MRRIGREGVQFEPVRVAKWCIFIENLGDSMDVSTNLRLKWIFEEFDFETCMHLGDELDNKMGCRQSRYSESYLG